MVSVVCNMIVINIIGSKTCCRGTSAAQHRGFGREVDGGHVSPQRTQVTTHSRTHPTPQSAFKSSVNMGEAPKAAPAAKPVGRVRRVFGLFVLQEESERRSEYALLRTYVCCVGALPLA